MSPASALAPAGPAHASDARLVRRALAGEEGALRVLVRRLLPVVHAQIAQDLAAWRAGDGEPVDVDAVTLEIWSLLFRDDGRRLLAHEPESGATLEGQAAALAHRALAERLDLPEPAPAAAAAGEPELEALWQHLRKRLPDRGRLVFRYLYTDGCSPAEAAQALDVSTQVIYDWRRRIREEARAFYAAHGGG